MSTVAIIGGDGAGKTTVAKRVLNTVPIPMKYLYMGRNYDSSNVAFPTSRLIQLLRRYLKNKSKTTSSKLQSLNVYIQQPEEWWTQDRRGKIFATVRLVNRLTEEWFRQFISWSYQLRGFVVLYDRHFILDYELCHVDPQVRNKRLTDRLHRWLLNHCYPKPDLVIFLDAPPEVLYSRKGETTLEYLRMCRDAFSEEAKRRGNFIRIDALQPLDHVCAEVSHHIMQMQAPKKTYSDD